ncbi:DUF3046 domain-containing protein [Xylanimonas allomyrinae]|uniref:DUF3046 domain-containing protein n=1 Tax=Xylanimonas allomyrinae TaxID=2509459 RepID=A0A4P6EJR7_9MICO|nr:DUF3046 domain-containing protein [Xylanimonas allomyrinae]QAY62306.1 DUF3046 domain-containing protein [Xylanimonas allomyrinae]
MRLREFWELIDEVFGPGYGRALAREQVLAALGDRTPAEALDAGLQPRDVWHALCDALDVPDADRWGTSRGRKAPPPSR